LPRLLPAKRRANSAESRILLGTRPTLTILCVICAAVLIGGGTAWVVLRESGKLRGDASRAWRTRAKDSRADLYNRARKSMSGVLSITGLLALDPGEAVPFM